MPGRIGLVDNPAGIADNFKCLVPGNDTFRNQPVRGSNEVRLDGSEIAVAKCEFAGLYRYRRQGSWLDAGSRLARLLVIARQSEPLRLDDDWLPGIEIVRHIH